MLINAFNKADEKQRAELSRWINLKNFDPKDKIAAVTRLYDEMGIDKLATDKIAYYFGESKKYLDAVQVAQDKKAELEAYASKMMKRKY